MITVDLNNSKWESFKDYDFTSIDWGVEVLGLIYEARYILSGDFYIFNFKSHGWKDIICSDWEDIIWKVPKSDVNGLPIKKLVWGIYE